MKRCYNCGELLDYGDWYIVSYFPTGEPDEVACSKCNEMFEAQKEPSEGSFDDLYQMEHEGMYQVV